MRDDIFFFGAIVGTALEAVMSDERITDSYRWGAEKKNISSFIADLLLQRIWKNYKNKFYELGKM